VAVKSLIPQLSVFPLTTGWLMEESAQTATGSGGPDAGIEEVLSGLCA
jgi:hypothetical protein